MKMRRTEASRARQGLLQRFTKPGRRDIANCVALAKLKRLALMTGKEARPVREGILTPA